jgi:MoaA/NifB/PqqE/SkfB family radical SAM enzyme
MNSYATFSSSDLKVRLGADGIHLFNRRSGINILLDEAIPSVDKWSEAPRQMSIALTNSCDLTCAHCYAPKTPAILSFDKLKNWLKEIDSNGCVGVGFGGGEPTLYPFLTELCAFTANETGLAVTMTTHGHRLDNQLLSELAGNLHFVRVSMDGVEATYEAIRRRSFDSLIKRIVALSTQVSFGINFVVNSMTIKDLDAAIALAESLGASEFLLLPEEPVKGRLGISEKTSFELRNWIESYRGKVPLAVSESKSEGIATCNPFNTEKGINAYCHIDAKGVLKRSSYDFSGVLISTDGVMKAISDLKKADI